MISIPQLKYIVELDNQRHFVTAAEKSFVTQPTLSMQVKKLEEQLGIKIFDRSKHPLEPTGIGEEIINQARVVLAENERIFTIVDEFQNNIEGDLRIGIIPSLSPYLLPLFIGKFASEYPKVNIKVNEMLSEEIIEGIQKGKLDMGLLVTPLKEKGIREKLLFYEKIYFYVNKKDPFAMKKYMDASLINHKGMWMLSEGHCFRSQMLNLCSLKEKVSEELGFQYESGSLETLKKFVEKEGGYTLVPELAVEKSEKAVHIPIKSSPIREVSLICSQNYPRTKLLQVFAKSIQQAVPQKMLSKNDGQVVEWR